MLCSPLDEQPPPSATHPAFNATPGAPQALAPAAELRHQRHRGGARHRQHPVAGEPGGRPVCGATDGERRDLRESRRRSQHRRAHVAARRGRCRADHWRGVDRRPAAAPSAGARLRRRGDRLHRDAGHELGRAGRRRCVLAGPVDDLFDGGAADRTPAGGRRLERVRRRRLPRVVDHCRHRVPASLPDVGARQCAARCRGSVSFACARARGQSATRRRRDGIARMGAGRGDACRPVAVGARPRVRGHRRVPAGIATPRSCCA